MRVSVQSLLNSSRCALWNRGYCLPIPHISRLLAPAYPFYSPKQIDRWLVISPTYTYDLTRSPIKGDTDATLHDYWRQSESQIHRFFCNSTFILLTFSLSFSLILSLSLSLSQRQVITCPNFVLSQQALMASWCSRYLIDRSQQSK